MRSLLLARRGALSSITLPEPPDPPDPPGTMEGSINITAGGTISNRWFRTTTTTPAVRVSTASLVIIENCIIESTATGDTDYLLEAAGSASNVIIRNCTFNGPNAFPSGGYGRAMRFANHKSAVIEHCTINRTGGIYFQVPAASCSILVRYNKMLNVQGSATIKRQFLQMNGIADASSIIAEWNQIINYFGQGVSEDVFSVYQSNGCILRNNYVQGGYPATVGGAHQGTGFVLGDGYGSNNLAEFNQIVGITNVGVGISGGSNNRILNNRIVSDGRNEAGTPMAAANNGCVCYVSSFGTPSGAIIRDNLIGHMSESGGVLTRNDFWTPAASNNVGAENTWVGGTLNGRAITQADEDAEWPIWVAKLASAGITVGAP